MTSPKSFEVPRCLSKCKMRGIATHLVELSVDAGQQREPRQKSHERDITLPRTASAAFMRPRGLGAVFGAASPLPGE